MGFVTFNVGFMNQTRGTYRHISAGFFLGIDDLPMVNDDGVSGIPVALGPANTLGEGRVVGQEELRGLIVSSM